MEVHTNGRLPDALTWREQDILSLLAERRTNREIAQTLGLELTTVKWYNREIYDKLGVNNRREAAARAEELARLEAGQESLPETDVRHNLPAAVTSFIGRESATQDVVQLIQTARLVTLTGPGGIGKTRLGVQAATQVVDNFADGVWYVELAALADWRGVAPVIVGALGLHESPDRSSAETLQEFARKREMLLFLDNFEHVLGAAPLVADLLTAAPGLRMLISSREILRLYGEQEYPVSPLAGDDAIKLFVQRALSARPGLSLTARDEPLVAEICARLDGLPLAIELAAARTRLMPMASVRDQLSDRFALLTGGPRDAHARQRTLRATIDWSHDLLDEEEKALLARLSVFQGGRTVEAVTDVCLDGLRLTASDGLEALLGKGLLGWEEGPEGAPIFVMLETIHTYAREKLDERGETDALRRRHAAYFLTLAEYAEPHLSGGRHQLRWLARFEAEHDNLRTALGWALDGGDIELGQRLTGALYWFWFRRGHHGDWDKWITRAVEGIEGAPPEVRARLLLAQGVLFHAQAAGGRGRAPLREAVALGRQVGDKLRTAEALVFLGGESIGRAHLYDEAVALCNEGLALFHEQGKMSGVAHALNVLGELARAVGDDDRAKAFYEECLALCLEVGDTLRAQLNYTNLAFVFEHEHDYQRAEALQREALALALEMESRIDIACSFTALAGPIGAQGRHERAARLMAAGAALREALGVVSQAADQVEFDRQEAAVRAQLDPATFEAAWAEGRAMSLAEAVAYALEEAGM